MASALCRWAAGFVLRMSRTVLEAGRQPADPTLLKIFLVAISDKKMCGAVRSAEDRVRRYIRTILTHSISNTKEASQTNVIGAMIGLEGSARVQLPRLIHVASWNNEAGVWFLSSRMDTTSFKLASTLSKRLSLQPRRRFCLPIESLFDYSIYVLPVRVHTATAVFPVNQKTALQPTNSPRGARTASRLRQHRTRQSRCSRRCRQRWRRCLPDPQAELR